MRIPSYAASRELVVEPVVQESARTASPLARDARPAERAFA
nr:hypothetical protein OH826_15830 [Streptomyces sp. NBC_00899]